MSPRQSDDERYPIADLVAVVTVTDDGGSSGRLRREYSVLPPGDIRNCMVALSQDEALPQPPVSIIASMLAADCADTASATCSYRPRPTSPATLRAR